MRLNKRLHLKVAWIYKFEFMGVIMAVKSRAKSIIIIIIVIILIIILFKFTPIGKYFIETIKSESDLLKKISDLRKEKEEAFLNRLIIDNNDDEVRKPSKSSSSIPPDTIIPVSKNVNEQRCRLILEKLFNDSFPSCRPKFLKNPKTGKPLELDCYNANLSIALEYNGKQHYVYPNYFHKSEEEFIKQQERDVFKYARCKELNIDLIIIDYKMKPDDFEAEILRQLKLFKRKIPKTLNKKSTKK